MTWGHEQQNLIPVISQPGFRAVDGFPQPPSAERAPEQMSKELEAEVEELRLTNRAKAILQSAYGMSEEEAHTFLRHTSRKTRKKLGDVAAGPIARPPLKEKAGTMASLESHSREVPVTGRLHAEALISPREGNSITR